jgi:hypothetical protein
MSIEPSVTTVSIPTKKRRFVNDEPTGSVVGEALTGKSTKRSGMTKAREIRLEQNKKSARESRRRKKAMLEELQQSVVFFTGANAALRTEHHLLTYKLLNAHTELNNLGLTMPETIKAEDDSKPTPCLATVTMPIVAAVVEPGATMQGRFRMVGTVMSKTIQELTFLIFLFVFSPVQQWQPFNKRPLLPCNPQLM